MWRERGAYVVNSNKPDSIRLFLPSLEIKLIRQFVRRAQLSESALKMSIINT